MKWKATRLLPPTLKAMKQDRPQTEPTIICSPHHPMTRFTIIALLLTLQVTYGAAPRLFQEKNFTAATFAEAVNHFVSLGEDSAVQELQGLVLDHSADFTVHSNGQWSVNERIGWMCRVLFEAKANEPLRPPAFGALNELPYNTMPLKNWPLYPIALSGSTYFVLSEGYSLGGVPEDPKRYIEYCRQIGVFREKPVIVPTRAQALKDAAAMRESVAWKAIKWTDSGEGWSYTLGGRSQWAYIQAQAEDIP
jgi:hypothetical protein